MVQERPWKLDRNAVLIHAPGSNNVHCLAHVTISFDQTRNQGLITIKTKLKLAGLNDRYQTIYLNIVPGAIDTASVTKSSFNNVLPKELSTMLRGVKSASAATTLSLGLKNPIRVLVPLGLTEPIRPADPSDGIFHAISRISQATRIRLHYCKQDISENDHSRLKTFASALTNTALEPLRINYTHLNGGMGAQDTGSDVFDQLPSLPTYNQVILSEATLGKRSRGDGATPDPESRSPCFPQPSWSATEVCSSFEVDMPTEVDEPDAASSHPVITTPLKVRQSTQDVAPFGSDVHDTQSTSTMCSPTMSAESRRPQEMSPSNIVPTVFRRGRSTPEPIAEPPRYQKKRPKLDLSLKDTPNSDDNALFDEDIVREIIQDIVDKEKQAILDEHQEMCDEAEIRVAEAIDDGRLAIIGKTDECCDEIDEHGQKVQEACADSCETLQADVACLEQASTLMEKAAAKVMSVSNLLAPLDCHPSTLAAQIITNDFEHLPTSVKVMMLTRVADLGFANVFIAVNHELRKELVAAWTKRRTGQ
ncbi:unnamed protein product [Aureobasidium vineae]|uniref:Uncharacterized protein n=1 Tax=Aureobasidium vineae TaxID=2773715 RepID=A0A9N8P6V4_9PEZI|nr:unnamed protein product [Aureobasidium vineae]